MLPLSLQQKRHIAWAKMEILSVVEDQAALRRLVPIPFVSCGGEVHLVQLYVLFQVVEAPGVQVIGINLQATLPQSHSGLCDPAPHVNRHE